MLISRGYHPPGPLITPLLYMGQERGLEAITSVKLYCQANILEVVYPLEDNLQQYLMVSLVSNQPTLTIFDPIILGTKSFLEILVEVSFDSIIIHQNAQNFNL